MIMSENLGKMTPFKLFLEQQKQISNIKPLLSNDYPILFVACFQVSIYLVAGLYVTIKMQSNHMLVLILLSFRNWLKLQNCLLVISEILLSFDEMKIQQNLVYDKYSGDLVGYVDLGGPDLNYASFKNQDDLATPVLIFYVPRKFELGYLATKGIVPNYVYLLASSHDFRKHL